MASQVDQWHQFVDRLTEQTRSGHIVWEQAQLQSSPYGDLVGTAYNAMVEGKLVGIHEYRYRDMTAEDQWGWFNGVALGVLAMPRGEYVWRAPVEPSGLLDQIRYQASGAGNLLESFLKAKSA